MMEMPMMRRKGFTLIELMVVLTIIVIVATASVPQIQLWNARNKGVAAVSMVISDFSKAKAMAGYSMTVDRSIRDTSMNPDGEFIRNKLFTAILYRKTSYSIIQQSGSDAWYTVNPLKQSKLPKNVSIESVNTASPNDNSGQSPATYIFTSTGRLKNTDGSLVLFGANATGIVCGNVGSPLEGTRIFIAYLKSKIDDNRSLWYQVEMDTEGETFICVETGGDSAPDFSGDTANIVEL